MTELDHTELMLCMGVAKTPGDTNSAERGLETLDLLGGARGFAVESGGWIPKRAQAKGGIWTDSPLEEGRILVADTEANVIESMTLSCISVSLQNRDWLLSQLERFRQATRDFWTTFWQIEPVYLRWWAKGAPGPQYAQIYRIDFDDNTSRLEGAQLTTINLVIEREAAWRGIAPADNPKKWTYEMAGNLDNFTIDTASLVFNSDHLIMTNINNKLEWQAAAAGAQNTLLTKNFIDVDANKIPGDAPALVQLSVTNSSTPLQQITTLFIAVIPHKSEGLAHDGVTKYNAYLMAAADGSTPTGTKTTATSADGVRSNGSSSNYYRVTQALTGASSTYTEVVTWGAGTGNLLVLDRHLLRGRYMAYARYRGATSLRMRLVLTEYEVNMSSATIELPETACTNPANYELAYLGTFTLPLSTRAIQALPGYGVQVTTGGNLKIQLQARNTAAGTTNLDVIDLILIPIHGQTSVYSVELDNGAAVNTTVVADSTGYLSRGMGDAAVSYAQSSFTGGISVEQRGQSLTLTPKMLNRIHFFNVTKTASNLYANPAGGMDVRLNIVPRWFGVRDV